MADRPATARRSGDPLGGRRFGALLAAIPSGWLAIFFVAPVLVLLAWSFQPPGMGTDIDSPWTLEAWTRNLSTASYWIVLGKTMLIAFAVASFAVLLAYPIAYVLARVAGRRRYLLLTLILLPSLVSYLLRLFAWRMILGTNGVLNSLLVGSGLIAEPLDFLLFNQVAVVIVLTYVWAPWAALPIFVRLEQIDGSLLEAADDLGAGPWRTFRRVTLPLSLPGAFAAFFFVFIPTLGDFATAAYVGGSSGQMYGNIIQQFLQGPDFPSGAVLSLLLLGVALASMALAFRVLRIREVSDVRI